MYHAEARFYDAKYRQFMSADPIKAGYNWYAYVGANPVTFTDPTGMWTFAIGMEQAYSFLGRLSFGGGVVFDDKGNFGLPVYGALGAGFPAVGQSFTITITNAETIYDTNGLGAVMGVSGNYNLISAGIEVVLGNAKDGSLVTGVTISGGAQAAYPIEFHGELTYTMVIPIEFIINKAKEHIVDKVSSFFNKLICEIKKEMIEQILGIKVDFVL